MPVEEKELLLYSDITYQIRGACFEIWKEFGGAFKEKVVERSLARALKKRGLEVETQKHISILFDGEKVGEYTPDMVVNRCVLIELKSKPYIIKEDERQFWLYLKGSEYKLGLLINFGSDRLDIRRRVYDKARERFPRLSA